MDYMGKYYRCIKRDTWSLDYPLYWLITGIWVKGRGSRDIPFIKMESQMEKNMEIKQTLGQAFYGVCRVDTRKPA